MITRICSCCTAYARTTRLWWCVRCRQLPCQTAALTGQCFAQEALLETDGVMFNGDDINLLRAPSMLHAHAWTAQDLASTFSPAGQGPSWYRLGYNPAVQ